MAVPVFPFFFTVCKAKILKTEDQEEKDESLHSSAVITGKSMSNSQWQIIIKQGVGLRDAVKNIVTGSQLGAPTEYFTFSASR